VRADFVNAVARVLNIKRRDLVEKDVILHEILTDLSQDAFFSDNFLFKGGTCLIKQYFGYVRFSEDVDFTWKDQTAFSKLSGNQLRKLLSKTIDKTGSVFETIAKNRGLDFKCAKSNTDYVELGGSDKTCTFKVWYESEVLKWRTFVKVQINFVEQIYFSPKKGQLSGLLTGKHAELDSLFPTETDEYAKKIPLAVYDIREILCEKVRALLTREGTKARDFVDIYLIWKQFGIKAEDEQEKIIDKIGFSLKLYAKYREHLKQKVALLNTGKLFGWGAEKELLLSDIDEEDFDKFLGRFGVFLKKIVAAFGY
jgi:predicted nucleotidyltransferase component of viral defense system